VIVRRRSIVAGYALVARIASIHPRLDGGESHRVLGVQVSEVGCREAAGVRGKGMSRGTGASVGGGVAHGWVGGGGRELSEVGLLVCLRDACVFECSRPNGLRREQGAPHSLYLSRWVLRTPYDSIAALGLTLRDSEAADGGGG
jgi:hypothetical protein